MSVVTLIPVFLLFPLYIILLIVIRVADSYNSDLGMTRKEVYKKFEEILFGDWKHIGFPDKERSYTQEGYDLQISESHGKYKIQLTNIKNYRRVTVVVARIGSVNIIFSPTLRRIYNRAKEISSNAEIAMHTYPEL